MNHHTEYELMLNEHGIKPTANRIVVARTLAEAGRPMSLTELEYKILSIDKSGVFRALQLFREHHLVHAVDDGSGVMRFELCHSHDAESDDDLHVHFHCERCQRTFCLTGTPLPRVEVPDEFIVSSASYTLKGLCPECKAKKN